jgi:hypothetical protein
MLQAYDVRIKFALTASRTRRQMEYQGRGARAGAAGLVAPVSGSAEF